MPYEAMTYPRPQQRWQTQPQRGELIRISASVEGEMIGFAVAECWQESEQRHVELVSSYVAPPIVINRLKNNCINTYSKQ